MDSIDKSNQIVVGGLTFRRPQMSDVPDLLEVKNNAKSAYLLGGIHHKYEEEDIKNWITFHNNQSDEVLFVVIENGKVIGHIGLYHIDMMARKAEYGILIANEQSKGRGLGKICTNFMTEYAYNQLGLNKVYAYLLSENVPSYGMFIKCGFVVEGCLKDSIYKNDKFYDELVVAKFKNVK